MNKPESILPLKTLIQNLKNGEEFAFERLYNLYSVKVFNFAKRYLKTDEDAQEIVQDVFLKLWDSRNNIDLDQSFNGFIFRITKNAALNKLRKKIGEPEKYSSVMENHSQSDHTEQMVMFNDMNALLESAIEGLPPKRQEIFRLSRHHGLANKEIAEKLNISVKTVEDQISKAIKYLKTYLDWVSLLVVLHFF